MDKKRWGRVLGFLVAALAGCAGVPHPLPRGDQMATTAEENSVRLIVPRLDSRSYPDHVLDVCTPVYVLLENDGDFDVSVSRQDFALALPSGLREAALPPRTVLALEYSNPRLSLPAAPAKAAPLSVMDTAPAAFDVGSGSASGVYVPTPTPVPPSGPPIRRNYGGLNYYYPQSIYSWDDDGYRDYSSPDWSGDPYFWGFPYSYYPHPRRSIIRAGLQNGTLPKNARSAGFLYFPLLPRVKRGETVTLEWSIYDSPARKFHGRVEVQLEFETD